MATKMPRYDPDQAGSVINWPLGSGSLIQEHRSADPNETLTDRRH